MTEKTILSIELHKYVSNGKFIVCHTLEGHTYLAALWPQYIGGHSDIHSLISEQMPERFPSEEEISDFIANLKKEGKDPHYIRHAVRHNYLLAEPAIREAITNRLKIVPDPYDYDDVLGGGHYSYNKGVLRFSGKSVSYGAVDIGILEEFRKPIEDYCKNKDIPLEALIIKPPQGRSDY